MTCTTCVRNNRLLESLQEFGAGSLGSHTLNLLCECDLLCNHSENGTTAVTLRLSDQHPAAQMTKVPYMDCDCSERETEEAILRIWNKRLLRTIWWFPEHMAGKRLESLYIFFINTPIKYWIPIHLFFNSSRVKGLFQIFFRFFNTLPVICDNAFKSKPNSFPPDNSLSNNLKYF